MCTCKQSQLAITSKISFAPWGNILLTSTIEEEKKGGGKDKHRLRQKGQAVNKHCDILDAIHKVARYIDGSLLHSQNGCQICSTGIVKVPGWTQVHIFFKVFCHTMVKHLTWNYKLQKLHFLLLQNVILILYYQYMLKFATKFTLSKLKFYIKIQLENTFYSTIYVEKLNRLHDSIDWGEFHL